MIPKLLHYVWVGGKPLPDTIKQNIKTWSLVNPDFEILQWDESNLDFSSNFIRRSYKLGYWARVADYARLDILKMNGGIYLDTDVKAIKPFDSLLDHKFFAGFEDQKGSVNNAVIGAERGHWFLEKALRRINETKIGLEEMDTSVGPGLFSALAKEYNLGKANEKSALSNDIFIAPPQYFYPFAYNEEYTETCITNETICVHLWEKSWQTPNIKINGTKKLQIFLKLYPSLFKHKLSVSVLEFGISLTELFAGNRRFLTHDSPWNRIRG